MDLGGLTIGHTDALEVDVLQAIPDIQDTLMALHYKRYEKVGLPPPLFSSFSSI